MIDEIPALNIFKGQTSKRLFFAKASSGDSVWHICDFAIGIVAPDQTIHSAALHDQYIYPVEQADTIEELKEKAGPNDSLCSGCMETYDYAREVIESRDMLKFSKPEPKPLIIAPDSKDIEIYGKAIPSKTEGPEEGTEDRDRSDQSDQIPG